MSQYRETTEPSNQTETRQLRRKRERRAARDPRPDRRITRRSFVATLVEPPDGADVDVTAHITRVTDAAPAIGRRGVGLHDSVLDMIADLLVEIAREEADPQALSD
jgi:hypothetical protein